MEVGLVTVGDELLTGDTVNTNAAWLCRRLSEQGVDVARVTVVPDEVGEIASVVGSAHGRYDAVIVTGGLGPTHDDVTMEAIARMFDRPLEENEAAREWLIAEGGYAAEDLVPETTHLPAGAEPLHNEVGVAPGARIDGVYVLPGVPTEMQAMFELIESDFEGAPRFRHIVRVADPESSLLDLFDHVQSNFDVTIGSYPGEHVRVVLTGEDPDEVREAASLLRSSVSELAPDDSESK